MEKFRSFDGVELSYHDPGGKGEPVILLHGFATSSRIDWAETGVYGALSRKDRRGIMLDARGHGESAKPHDSYSYCNRAMARDVNALAELLGLTAYDVMGCSMGAKVAIEAALMCPGIRRLVLVGLDVYERGWQYNEAERLARVKNMLSRRSGKGDAFRLLAERYGGDRRAYAARLEGAALPEFTRDDLGSIRIPVLVVNGKNDVLDASEAASYFPDGRGAALGGDYRTVLGCGEFHELALSFLDER